MYIKFIGQSGEMLLNERRPIHKWVIFVSEPTSVYHETFYSEPTSTYIHRYVDT